MQYEDEEIYYKVMRQDIFTTNIKQVYNKIIMREIFPFYCHELITFISLYMFMMHTPDTGVSFRYHNCGKACEITAIKVHSLEKDL